MPACTGRTIFGSSPFSSLRSSVLQVWRKQVEMRKDAHRLQQQAGGRRHMALRQNRNGIGGLPPANCIERGLNFAVPLCSSSRSHCGQALQDPPAVLQSATSHVEESVESDRENVRSRQQAQPCASVVCMAGRTGTAQQGDPFGFCRRSWTKT